MSIPTRFRRATGSDAAAIAALHADSWRRHYRGSFADDYLDGDVDAERLAVWTDRFAHPAPGDVTIVAEDGGVVGFAHVVLGDDARWGALLDNLHVRYDAKRRGLGRALMAEAAAAVVERDPGSGLYLWVLERNTAAQAFYEAQGGRAADREVDDEPGGGTVVGIRYVWPDPTVLLGVP